MTFWERLEPNLHPQDRPAPASWRRGYEAKFALARLMQPRSILEIGVRAGYSAFAFLTACPEARYLGLDNNSDASGGFRGAMDHARTILASFNATVLELSSAQYAERMRATTIRPVFDLIHVDGDHSCTGCLADLELAASLRPRVIQIDDVLALSAVYLASEQFLADAGDAWLSWILPDGHHGVRLLIASPLAEFRRGGHRLL